MEGTSLHPGPLPLKKNAELAVVIVNYCSADDVVKCVDSLARHQVVPQQCITVVDNDSPDGSGKYLVEALPGIRVLLSETNRGFGGGVNFGIGATDADFFLVLNPDVYFENNAIRLALDVFLDEKVAIVGLNLKNRDGSSQYSARRYYSLMTMVARRIPFVGRRHLRSMVDEHLMVDMWRPHAVFDAPWVVGAAFIVRRSAFDAIGGMDDRFFLYMEDTDLCRRLWRRGFKVKAINDVTVVHVHQRASARKLFSRSSWAHLQSLFRYTFKYGMPFSGHDKA